MGDIIFLLSVGVILILAGIFKWYLILAFFAHPHRVKTNKGVMVYRIVSIILGIGLIFVTIKEKII